MMSESCFRGEFHFKPKISFSCKDISAFVCFLVFSINSFVLFGICVFFYKLIQYLDDISTIIIFHNGFLCKRSNIF